MQLYPNSHVVISQTNFQVSNRAQEIPQIYPNSHVVISQNHL